MRTPYESDTAAQLRPRRMTQCRHRLPVYLAAVLVLLSCSAWKLAAQNPKPTEYEVEAAYLFNFGKFVSWPQQEATSRGPFTICVLGDDPFGTVLDRTTAGEAIGDKKVIDRRISRPQDAVGCSILYIGDSEAEQLGRVLAAVKDAPALTVSNVPGFLERGGMIQFVLENGRVRFGVNLSPTQQHGLILSSELLKVAVKVTRIAGQEGQ